MSVTSIGNWNMVFKEILSLPDVMQAKIHFSTPLMRTIIYGRMIIGRVNRISFTV